MAPDRARAYLAVVGGGSGRGADGRTRVYLTVDVEAAEERLLNGHLQPPLGYELRVWGRFGNQRDELGVPRIVAELRRAGLRATFFVEALGAAYFGERELAGVCRFLLDAGHDVQLHLHPVQRRPDWHTRGEPRPSDDIADYSIAEQTQMLAHGCDVLGACGVPRAALLAFRAGNFGASNDTWRALATAGLRVSSSLNRDYLDRNCRIRWPGPTAGLIDTGLGVWELPVSGFSEPGGRFRPLQITAVSFPEMRHALCEANRLGLPEVTIVTHPFELFVIDSPREGRGRPNVVNVERLRRLLDFLATHDEMFTVDTVGALAERLALAPVPHATTTEIPRGRPALRLGRLAEQAYKRLMARLPLPV